MLPGNGAWRTTVTTSGPSSFLIYRKFNISFLRDFGNESAAVSPTCDKPRGFGHPRFSFVSREGRLLDSGAGEPRGKGGWVKSLGDEWSETTGQVGARSESVDISETEGATATPRPASRVHGLGLVPAVFADPNASAVHRDPGAGQSRSSSAGMRPNVVAEASLAVPGPPARRPRRGCRSSREARADRSTGCCAGSGRGCDRLGWPRTRLVKILERPAGQQFAPSQRPLESSIAVGYVFQFSGRSCDGLEDYAELHLRIRG